MGGDLAARGSLPAAGRAPLRFYDAAVAVGMRERTFRSRLIEHALSSGPRLDVLDVGCGTGTLAIALAGCGARVLAIDPDPVALGRARRKRGAEAVSWVQGSATELPVAGESVDRVVLSLVLHHLEDGVKLVALREALRVLRPGGSLHVAEWTQPGDPLMRLAFRGLQMVDGRAGTASLGRGELAGMLSASGFSTVVQHDRLRTAFGRLALVEASSR